MGLAQAEIEQQRDSKDPRVAEPARQLLAKLEKVPRDELPPPGLREQLMRAAPRAFGDF